LARKATGHDFASSTPQRSVEGSHVVEDWEGGQDSIGLSLCEHFAAIGIDFDGDGWAMTEQEATEDSSAAACKEMAFI
jgi:hypothetical protein